MTSLTLSDAPHVPCLRMGEPYNSLDQNAVIPLGSMTGEPLAEMSVVNAGIVRRDALRKAASAAQALREIPCQTLVEMCKQAGELFMHGELPFGDTGDLQSADDYVRTLSSTSGLPHVLVRKNMEKITYVLTHMDEIIRGLTRGLDLDVIDKGIGQQAGVDVAYFTDTDLLGVVLPSNSPGVNSIWLPAIPLKVPVMLKPGREEPWTPWRLIQAFIKAGIPREAFGFYPTDHEGAGEMLRRCGRGIIFGDDRTLSQYRANPHIECHGTGFSKVILGPDAADHWQDHVELIATSIAANGGRSCINASTIITPRHGRALAEALAACLATIEPRPADAADAQLSAFANPAFADYIDGAIDEGLESPGAVELTAQHRIGPRRVETHGLTFLQPTLVWCDDWDHELINREFLMPFATVVELPSDEIFQKIGPTLVATVISDDPAYRNAALRCGDIDRLNLGPIPTSKVQWDQPHEGNLFEFLYERRAIQSA